MAGLADLALGTAPIAGGFLLAMVTGQFKTPTKPKAPDFRGMITQDQEILRAGSRKSRPPAALNCSTPSMSASMTSSMPFTAAARFATGSALIRAAGATWCCLFALCCSQSSGGRQMSPRSLLSTTSSGHESASTSSDSRTERSSSIGDNLQETAGPNPSGRSMIVGPVEAGDLDKTEANKRWLGASSEMFS